MPAIEIDGKDGTFYAKTCAQFSTGKWGCCTQDLQLTEERSVENGALVQVEEELQVVDLSSGYDCHHGIDCAVQLCRVSQITAQM